MLYPGSRFAFLLCGDLTSLATPVGSLHAMVHVLQVLWSLDGDDYLGSCHFLVMFQKTLHLVGTSALETFWSFVFSFYFKPQHRYSAINAENDVHGQWIALNIPLLWYMRRLESTQTHKT